MGADTPAQGRLAAGRARVASQRKELTARFEAARGRSGPVDAMARAWEHDIEVGGGLMAGALAFRLFMFMVPFSLVALTLLGSTAEVVSSSPNEMAQRAGISGVLAQAIVTTDSLTTTHQVVLLLVGGYALIMAARSVVATIAIAYCLAWRMPPEKMKRLKPALLFIAFFTSITAITNYLGRLRDAAPAPGIAVTLAWLLVPLAASWWASTRLPHGHAPSWALLPGAVVFAVGLQVMHLFTVVYIGWMATSKSETYGALGVSLAVLLWAYVAGRLLTGTAVVNAALWRRFEENHPEHLEIAQSQGEGITSHLRLWLIWARSAAGLLR